MNAIGNLTINENAGLQTVNLSGISSGAANEVQTLTVTATSSNPALIPSPTVSYTSPNTTGTLNFTPAVNGNGTAIVTVTVNDNGASNNIVTRTFTVTINPVNQTPTLNTIGNVTINQDAGLQTVNLSGIGSGAANEVQPLTVTAASSNPALVPNPTVTYPAPTAPVPSPSPLLPMPMARLLKVLGDGQLTKSLKIVAHRFSRTATEKIEQAGGQIVVLPGKAPVVKNKQKTRIAK